MIGVNQEAWTYCEIVFPLSFFGNGTLELATDNTTLGSMTLNGQPSSGRITDDVVVMAVMVAMTMLTVLLTMIQS